MKKLLPFEHTRRALVEFDAGLIARQAAWNNVDCGEDVEDCEKADTEALNKVREAFYEDTKHVNSRDNCMRVDLEFMRKRAADLVIISVLDENGKRAIYDVKPEHLPRDDNPESKQWPAMHGTMLAHEEDGKWYAGNTWTEVTDAKVIAIYNKAADFTGE